MNVGFIGLGKLGTPVAVALGTEHHVMGYDINPELMQKGTYPHKEAGGLFYSFQQLFDQADLTFHSLEEICRECEIIFVAVQTPHLPEYEGITRMPDKRADFDYSYLVDCINNLSKFVTDKNTIVIISTVLPGTIDRHILPILEGRCSLVYSPLFIAMGTVVQDFLNPEFVLLGSNDKKALDKVKEFYKEFYIEDRSVVMSIESAELTKVAYNTFISLKIVYANTLMEICNKIPNCNVDDVIKAISKATDRLISPKYLTGGMGDGGGCHPRDNIAMSWLAQKLNLSYDIFEENIKARENQSEYLVNLMLKHEGQKIILGKSFKPETNIITGSPAYLCASILQERNERFLMFDPFIDNIKDFPLTKAIYLIATKHNFFKDLIFPEGSVIIDPHRYIADQKRVKVIRIGE